MRGLVLLGLAAVWLPAQSVPSTYQAMYNTLSTDLNSFTATINASWNKSTWPVTYSTELLSANSNQGSYLIGPTYYTYAVLPELNAAKALGVNAVMLSIDFPLLYEPYWGNATTYQQYLNFYIQLAADVRARGMKLIVETHALEPGATINASSYLSSLSLSSYENGRMQQAVTIAQQLKPDYLSVITEPDTEAYFSGQPVGTVSGASGLLNVILAGLQQAAVRGVQIGAGVGSWTPSYLSYVDAFAPTSIQYFDMHVYPINNGLLTNAFSIASEAAKFGKPLAISEAWLDKENDNEVTTITNQTLNSRQVFSFWEPLDAGFVQALWEFANYEHLTFVSPSWSNFFRAYLTYNSTTQNEPASQLITQEQTAATKAIGAGQITPLATAYAALYTNPPDTTPPSTPAGLTATPAWSSATIKLAWTASTDNIGVLGYRIYRNGSPIGTTAATSYSDATAVAGATYSYSVSAYDLAGNTSRNSATASATAR